MKMVVGTEFTPIRSGVEARSPDLRICGHGKDRLLALDSLKVSVQAWVIGLMRADPDLLVTELQSKGIQSNLDGETVEIEFEEI